VSAPVTNNSVTIANNASLSGAFYVGHGRLVSIIMPATWTAAVLTFQGSDDGVTFYDIYDSNGTEVSATVAAAHMVTIDEFMGAPWMKLRSGTGASAVAQGGARTLIPIVQKLPGMSAP
jgi:hypothetical protein